MHVDVLVGGPLKELCEVCTEPLKLSTEYYISYRLDLL